MVRWLLTYQSPLLSWKHCRQVLTTVAHLRLSSLACALALSYNSFHLQGRESTMSLCLDYGWQGNSLLLLLSVRYEVLLYPRHNTGGFFFLSFLPHLLSPPCSSYYLWGLIRWAPRIRTLSSTWLQSLSLLIGFWYPNASKPWLCSQNFHFHTATA